MSVVEAFRVAFGGLLANRLRSALTMLGILIGVGAVITLVAVGNGASAQVQGQVENLGSNVLYVYPSNQKVGGISQGFGSTQSLSMADVDAIMDPKAAPDVVTAIPITQSNGTLTHGSQNWQASLTGSTEDFPQVRSYAMSSGQFFTGNDVRSDARVAVVGQTVVDNLFNGDDPIGQTVKINRQSFRVIGVFATKGATSFGSSDNIVVVPITSAWAYLLGNKNKTISQIVVQARSQDSLKPAQDEVTSVLLDRHHVPDPTQPDFQIINQQDIANAFNQITQTLTLLLGAIAAISLVVGGIGIMNIMLVTVTERTREIGIRKAIGARWRDILLQFLIESMVLSGIGGLLGIVVGALVATVLPRVVSQLPPPIVSLPSVLLAFGVSVGIGLFFGIYPANRAARLNPIEALRYE
jgi:putative ABC transport system permease protein